MNKYAVSELLSLMEEELGYRDEIYHHYQTSKVVGSDLERRYRLGELRGRMDGFESAYFMVRSYFESLQRQSR